MRAAAIVAVRNEEVHIARCLTDLIADGIDVVLIDNDSEDRSIEIAKQFLARGLLSIERLPWTGNFALKEQLAAKTRIIANLPHDWLLHVDADERLQSPWPNMRLLDAIKRVDGRGYNCINFEEVTFVTWPQEDFWEPGYARLMTTYYFFEPSKTRLMRAWKAGSGFNNIETGGHRLDGTPTLFPEYFTLRHYIGLSPEYVFQKYSRRVFAPDELAAGWHHDKVHWRIGITREMCMLQPSPHLKKLSSVSSVMFDKTSPARTHYWQWTTR